MIKTIQIPHRGFFSKYGDENRNALLGVDIDYVVEKEYGDYWVVFAADIDDKPCRALVHKDDVVKQNLDTE